MLIGFKWLRLRAFLGPRHTVHMGTVLLLQGRGTGTGPAQTACFQHMEVQDMDLLWCALKVF